MEWEYEIIDNSAPLQSPILNTLGKRRWELVTIIHEKTGFLSGENIRHSYVYYFKRPVTFEQG